MNILISGMTCSGKTSLSNQLSHELNILHFEEDWYFKNKEDIKCTSKGYLMDLPSSFHLDEFKKDVKTLIEEKETYTPVYDIKTNKRINKTRQVKSNEIIIFEGLHTISTLKDLRNTLKVFIDIDKELALIRRIERDKKYGISEEEIKRYFNEVIMSIYKSHIASQKKEADIILNGGDDIKCLSKKLQTYL